MSDRTDEQAAAADELAVARQERRDASQIIALLRIGADDDGTRPSRLYVRRREIELQVAELRLALWIAELRRLEQRVRALGLRP